MPHKYAVETLQMRVVGPNVKCCYGSAAFNIDNRASRTVHAKIMVSLYALSLKVWNISSSLLSSPMHSTKSGFTLSRSRRTVLPLLSPACMHSS